MSFVRTVSGFGVLLSLSGLAGCDEQKGGEAPAGSAAASATASTPAAVCQRMEKLGDEPMDADEKKDCVDTFTEMSKTFPADWGKLSTCMTTAKGEDDLDKCLEIMDKVGAKEPKHDKKK